MADLYAVDENGLELNGNQRRQLGPRVSPRQMEIIINSLQTTEYACLARGGVPFQGLDDSNISRKSKWDDLAILLNAEGPAVKGGRTWKTFWSSRVSNARAVAAAVNVDARRTGEGKRKARPVTDLEALIIKLAGEESVRGNAGVHLFDVQQPMESESVGNHLELGDGVESTEPLRTGQSPNEVVSPHNCEAESPSLPSTSNGARARSTPLLRRRIRQKWKSIPTNTVQQILDNQAQTSRSLMEMAASQREFNNSCVQSLERLATAAEDITAAITRQTDTMLSYLMGSLVVQVASDPE